MAWAQQGNIRGPEGPAGAAGAQGAQGVQGPAGPAGLTWRGAWANANAYAVNDAVSWGGSTYFATAGHAANANQPPTGTTAAPGADDTAVNAGWAVLSLEGAQGPQGIQGPAGPAGAAGAQGAQGIQGPAGAAGVAGPQGAQGPAGTNGARGSQWYTGHGAPGAIGGVLAGDQYLDLDTGNVYTFA